jgi:hypothetical protein
MDLDVDTFLVTVYCVCDDLYRAHWATSFERRCGAKPRLSDSEVLTLAVLAQFEPHRSERAFVRLVQAHWRAYFPHLLSHSAFHRRVRALGTALCALGPLLARELEAVLGERCSYEVWDGVPIPLMRRCRGRRQRLCADAAGFGHGGSDRELYYGMHLLAAVTAQGAIRGFVVGPAATSEYWLAEARLRWRRDPRAPAPTARELAALLGPRHCVGGQRVGPTGPLGPSQGVGRPASGPALADLGFTGRAWRAHWRRDYGAAVLTKADYAAVADERARARWTSWLCGVRQVVETAFGCLAERLGITFPRGRSQWGVWLRLAAKVAAHNATLYVNALVGRPTFAPFNPLA